MKKLMMLMLSVVMLLTMVACRSSEEPESTGEQESQSTTDNTVSNNTNAAVNWDGKSTLEIMQIIADNADTQIAAEVIEGDEMYFNALTLGELEFEEISLYMPMISSQRFEVAVIRVKDGTNVASYVSDLEERAVNAQWICAAAPDYVKVVAVGDCVLYMAINSEFANEDAMLEAFRNPVA